MGGEEAPENKNKSWALCIIGGAKGGATVDGKVIGVRDLDSLTGETANECSFINEDC